MPKPHPARFETPKPKSKRTLRQTHKKTVKRVTLAERKLLVLTGKQRTFLRGLAHNLNPLLQVGKGGMTAGLLEELDRALDSHELIKLRLLRECPEDVSSVSGALEKKLKANVVAKLGHVLVLYRRNPEQCRIALPAEKKKSVKLPEPAFEDDFENDDEDSEDDAGFEDDDEEEA